MKRAVMAIGLLAAIGPDGIWTVTCRQMASLRQVARAELAVAEEVVG